MHKRGQHDHLGPGRMIPSNAREDASLKHRILKHPGGQVRWKEREKQSEPLTCPDTLTHFMSSNSSDGIVFILPNPNSIIQFTKPIMLTYKH